MKLEDIHTQEAGDILNDVWYNNRGIVKKTANVISPDGKIQWFNIP